MEVKSASEVTQSCPTLSDPTDCSPPGSSIHGILQARVLEWVAMAFSVPAYKISEKTKTWALDGITDSMDASLSELRELVIDREVHGVAKSWSRLSD